MLTWGAPWKPSWTKQVVKKGLQFRETPHPVCMQSPLWWGSAAAVLMAVAEPGGWPLSIGRGADHVGAVRVCGGGVGAAAVAHDAEGQGGGEVHGTLCFCAGPVPLHQLRALDLAARRWQLLPSAGLSCTHCLA